MESLARQTSRDFEYILIDGGSTDGSVGVIKSFSSIPSDQYRFEPDTMCQSKISPVTYWISEPDKGIYNAMNKGLGKASGEFVHFLNSGDWLTDEHVVEKMLKALSPQCDILVGEVIFVRPDGRVRYGKNNINVSFFTFYGSTIHHSSAYIRKSLFEEYGLYDESLKVVADWKWYLIVVGLNNARVRFADICVSCFDTTGISSTNINLDKTERRQVLKELLPEPILADYDKYHFDISQIERIKKYKWLYHLFWFIERGLFKIEKWQLRFFGWKNDRKIHIINNKKIK